MNCIIFFLLALLLPELAPAVPNNPYFCALQDTGVEDLTVYLDQSAAPNAEVAKTYIYHGLQSDSAGIVTSFTTRTPDDSMTVSQIQLGETRNFSGLKGGTVYFFFTATVSAARLFCAQNAVAASLRKILTKPYPVNVLNLSASPGYNTIGLTLSNISQLNPNSVDKSRIYVYVSGDSLVDDPKCAGCRRDTLNLTGAGDSYVYTVKSVQPGKTYYFSVSFQDYTGFYAPIDTAGANKNGLSATTLAAIPLPIPSRDSVAVSLIDPQTLKVDWTKLLNAAEVQSNRFLSDAVAVITDTNFFTGILTSALDNQQVTTAGAVFVNRLTALGSKLATIAVSGLDYSTVKYVAFALKARDDPAGPFFYSAPSAVGTVQQSGSDPSIEGLFITQLDSASLRIQFTPRDPDQSQLSVWANYRIDGIEGDYVGSSSLGNVNLGIVGGAPVQNGQACTAYVDLAGTFVKTINQAKIAAPYFKNSDTTLLTVLVHVDDGDSSSGSDSQEVSLTIDLRAPAPPRLFTTIDYDADSSRITVTVADTRPGDLQKIYFGAAAADRFKTALDFVPPSATIVLQSQAVYLAFSDSFGNTSTVDWTYFVNQPVALAGALDTAFDLGGLKLSLESNTPAGAGRTLNLGRYTFSAGELSSIGAQGFVRLKRDGYVLLSQAALSGGQRFYDQGFDLYLRCDTGDADLKIYRYLKESDKIEFLGGRYLFDALTGSGYLAAENLGDDSANFYRYYDPLAGAPATADSMFVFLGLDTVEPVIDTAATTLDFDGSAMRLHVRARDNTVNLDARVQIFGFEGEQNDNRRGWERVAFFSKNLYDLDGPAAAGAVADADFIKTGVADTSGVPRSAATLDRGLYAAVAVTDAGPSRRKHFFLSLERALARWGGAYGKMNSWRLVSFPYAPAASGPPLHLLDVLKPAFQGRYDRNRFRLYRLKNRYGPGESPFAEFSADYESGGVEKNSRFVFSPDVSYLMTTRNPADNGVHFSRDSVKTLGFKGERGVLTAFAGTADSGWRLLSLPFRGAVAVQAVDRVSVTARPVPLSERIFKLLGTGADPWKKMDPMDPSIEYRLLGSAADHSDCFLVYLHPGDSLLIPLTDDSAFFKGTAARASNATPRWTLDVTLKTSSGEMLDGFNRLGVAGGNISLPDLPTMGPAVLSIVDPVGIPLSQSLRSVPGWRISVFNRTDSLLFLRLDWTLPPPEAGPLYLLNREAGLVTDMAMPDAAHPFLLGPRSRMDFEINPSSAQGLLPPPSGFNLAPIAPNPFNPSAAIHYQVPFSALEAVLSVEIYNADGKRVGTLFRGPARPGYHGLVFSGVNGGGRRPASGLYFCRLTAIGRGGKTLYSKIRRMVLIR